MISRLGEVVMTDSDSKIRWYSKRKKQLILSLILVLLLVIPFLLNNAANNQNESLLWILIAVMGLAMFILIILR